MLIDPCIALPEAFPSALLDKPCGRYLHKAGAGIELTFDVDASILGGVVLKVGDRVLDASLRAQLAILRETFKRGE